MLKDNIRKQTVWFKANEELQVLNWLADEVNVALAPNMAIRYLCMKALQENSRFSVNLRVDLLAEEGCDGPNNNFSAIEPELLNVYEYIP